MTSLEIVTDTRLKLFQQLLHYYASYEEGSDYTPAAAKVNFPALLEAVKWASDELLS